VSQLTRYAECLYAECHYADCHFTECNFPEYHMNMLLCCLFIVSIVIKSVIGTIVVMLSVVRMNILAPITLLQKGFMAQVTGGQSNKTFLGINVLTLFSSYTILYIKNSCFITMKISSFQ
jgi:hypothetical protein